MYKNATKNATISIHKGMKKEIRKERKRKIIIEYQHFNRERKTREDKGNVNL